MARPPRLIDLHCDWILQYAGETTVFDPALYPGVADWLGQAEGYLTGASAAVVACYRDADDWARQPQPWRALGDLIARVEAEFPGRLLIGPDDHARWVDEPDALCWAVLGVEGFDFLVREPADFDRLPDLFDRGVRVFQPAYGATSALAGTSAAGDDRGLTDLGVAFLQTLADLGPAPGVPGPRPVLDLAHLNPRAMSEALAWFEADADRPRRLIPVYSHGVLRHDGFDRPRAITPENLTRLRALGGVAGFTPCPPFYDAPDQFRAALEAAAALPFAGRTGFEGVAVGTDFLGVDATLPGLANADEVVAWLAATFPADVAAALIAGNARALIARAVGVECDGS
jgi:membrane dipeptidase